MNNFVELSPEEIKLLGPTELELYNARKQEHRTNQDLIAIVNTGTKLTVPQAKGAQLPEEMKGIVQNATIIGRRNLQWAGSGSQTDLFVSWKIKVGDVTKTYFVTTIKGRGEFESLIINPGTKIEGINVMFEMEHAKDGTAIPTVAPFANIQSEMVELEKTLTILNGTKKVVIASNRNQQQSNQGQPPRKEQSYAGSSDPEPGAYDA